MYRLFPEEFVRTVDCRGMACPAPVIATKKNVEEATAQPVTILVDDGAARENVSRFLTNRGYRFTETALENGYSLIISGITETVAPQTATDADHGGRVFLITSDRIGDGPEELGKLLMKNFIITLLDQTDLPERLFFLNTGVHLTTQGSELVEPLSKLADLGVEIMSCGLCLDYFHKKDVLAVGAVTNMYSTAEALMRAGSVIKL